MPALVAPVKKGVGATFGSGEQWQSWIHIEDLISLFEHLVEKHLYGVYNAVAPNPVTHKKMLHEIASRLHKPLWLPAIPKSIMKLLLGKWLLFFMIVNVYALKKLKIPILYIPILI